MRKIYVLLIFLLLFFVPQSINAQSGTCGTNVKYTINGNTINFSKSKSGSEAYYSSFCTDVFKKDPNITVVNITDTIRASEGKYLFYECDFVEKMNLSSVLKKQ